MSLCIRLNVHHFSVINMCIGLVSQSAMLKVKSVQGCRRFKYKTYCLLNDPWVILPTSQAFNYLSSRGDEIIRALDPPKFVDKITIEDRMGYSLWHVFLKRYSTKF